jgi:hypothetical protein
LTTDPKCTTTLALNTTQHGIYCFGGAFRPREVNTALL